MVGDIEIVRHNVFDREGQDSWPFRVANAVHIRTREAVIRRELLFEVGERLDREDLGQSERNLRKEDYFSEVRVEILTLEGVLIVDPGSMPEAELCVALTGHESVRVRVTTFDSWSTTIETKLRKTDDRLIFGVGLIESNLLGRGKNLELAHRANIDRSSNVIAFTDPRIAGSRVAFTGEFGDQSDGRRAVAQVSQPFFSLDSEWAFKARLETFDQRQPLYRGGDAFERLRHVRQWQEFRVSRLVRRRESTALRFDFAYRRLRDDVNVEKRKFGVLQVGISSEQHRFLEITHLNHERSEDLNIGAESALSVGLSTSAFGGDGTALFVSGSQRRGFPLGSNRIVFSNVSWSGRFESSQVRNGIADARFTFLDLSVPRKVFLVSAWLRQATNLDPEVQITLGAQNGLRGFPVHQFVGTKSLLLSAETRWFVLDNVFNFMSLGLAAFVDSGYAWAEGVDIDLGDLTTNVGFSLLMGRKQVSTRRAGTRIDIAYALDPVFGTSRWVLSFGNDTRFVR